MIRATPRKKNLSGFVYIKRFVVSMIVSNNLILTFILSAIVFLNVCPSIDPFYIITYNINSRIGHYFLDRWYI